MFPIEQGKTVRNSYHLLSSNSLRKWARMHHFAPLKFFHARKLTTPFADSAFFRTGATTPLPHLLIARVGLVCVFGTKVFKY
jgi:hypothetical protein